MVGGSSVFTVANARWDHPVPGLRCNSSFAGMSAWCEPRTQSAQVVMYPPLVWIV